MEHLFGKEEVVLRQLQSEYICIVFQMFQIVLLKNAISTYPFLAIFTMQRHYCVRHQPVHCQLLLWDWFGLIWRDEHILDLGNCRLNRS